MKPVAYDAYGLYLPPCSPLGYENEKVDCPSPLLSQSLAHSGLTTTSLTIDWTQKQVLLEWVPCCCLRGPQWRINLSRFCGCNEAGAWRKGSGDVIENISHRCLSHRCQSHNIWPELFHSSGMGPWASVSPLINGLENWTLPKVPDKSNVIFYFIFIF